MANTAQQRHLILLEPHPRTAAVSEASTPKLGLDFFDGDGEARRKALDDYRQGLTMRFPSSQVTKHVISLRGDVVRAGRVGDRAWSARATIESGNGSVRTATTKR